MRSLIVPCAVLLFLVALVSCTPLSEKRVPGEVDPKLSQSTYIEDGNLLALIVGTRPARFREQRDYIPLEVAVVNKGLEGISFTSESFTLVDEDGNRYGTVGREELVNGYGNIDLDRRLGEIEGVVLGRYQAFERVQSTLAPSFDKPIVRRSFLAKYTYVVDFLYFPKPLLGVKGRRFELFLDAPELDDPVFVKFEVEGKALQDS